MNKQAASGLTLVVAIIGALAVPSARAQSAFSNAVVSLNPIAYWPLQETAQPPAPDMEINLGSLGAAGNAVYSSTNVVKGMPPIPGDAGDFSIGTSITANGSFLAVPTAGGAATLPAGPFTVEAWIYPTNITTGSTVIGQTGPAGSGGFNGGANSAGWSLNVGYIPSLNATMAGTITFHVYNGVGSAGGAEATFASSAFTTNSWYHVVGVYDGTNAILEVNKVLSSFRSISGGQALDTWDLLTIGCGRGLNNNKFGGNIDEVAIYTNALSTNRINAHFDAGNGGGNYQNTVLADNPYMYWRMDAPAHTTSPASSYPTAFNYGTGVGINGLYLSGTTPGAAGPTGPGFDSPSYGCAFNGIGTDDTNSIPIFTNGVAYSTNRGVVTGVIITNLLSSMNLVTNSMSYMAWFKENPEDNRRGVLIGHSDSGWRTSMDGGGHVTCNTGKGGDQSSSPLTYNDGNWHFAVIVYANSGVPTNTTGWLATNYLYVDGLLTASALITNADKSGTFTNILIGSAPDKASGNGGSYADQVLSGSLAHVAFFNTALTASQIVNLYTNATGGSAPAPVITGQPVSGRTNSPGTGNNGSGPGSYIFMGVQASGASSYQWYFNSSSNYAGATQLTSDNVKYVGATTANMTISNLVDSDSGYYYVVAANGFGSVTSILASFTVINEPFITSQAPAGSTLQLYQNQNFTLSVTAGGTNLTYQWYTNGVADTTAGTNSTYSLVSVQTAMSGNTYYCIVSNGGGTATNSTVTLTVQPLPSAISNSAYSMSLLALNPNAYFPMHETGPAAPGDTETNYGTLGSLGDGAFADWNVNNGFPGDQVILHHVAGALTSDSDGAEDFNYRGQTNSYLLVPHTSAQTTLNVPFTIESWVWGANTTFGDIVSQDGTKLNTGNANNVYGFRLGWGGNIQVLVGSGTSLITSSTLSFFQWHHVVLTCDTNNNTTNFTLYVDGGAVGSKTAGFIPDSWDPLTIGAGLWNGGGVTRIASNLAIDEVAIYNTNLDANTIFTHYNDGINGAAGQYFNDVTNLQPVLYYRMDRPAYNMPDISTWPVMTNYGSAGVNGVYSPGLAPGSVAGPNNGGGLFARNLSGTNAAPMNGMNTFAESFDTNTFNVVGQGTPLSFAMWFRSNPSDARYQTLVSQGPGWQLSQQVNGTLQFFLGNSFVNTRTVCNDGNWHQVVVTYSTNVGTLYVDGALDSSATNASLTNPPPTAVSTCIGCDVRFTTANQATGAGRQYAGNICEMAFWKGTALTAAQVQTLYNSAAAAPFISTQPISASANENSAFTNTVVVSGSNPLSYQWYRDNLPLPIGGQTNLIIGATNASLIIAPVKPSDASANYYLVVTNSGGAVTSSVVSLSVFTQPIFTNEPVATTHTNNILLFSGALPTFRVATVGAQPTYYQWFTNNVAATAQGTTLTNYAVLAEPGLTNFYCIASNFVGMATDTVVGVTILSDPTAPYPQAVLTSGALGYWRLNEPEQGGGNPGVIADDYLGGNNGIFTNTDLGQIGYNAATDPTTTSARFGFDSLVDGDAYGINGVDFSAPAGSNVAFTVEAWVNGYSQSKDAGIVSKGYGNGGEQFDLDVGSHVVINGQTTRNFRFLVRDASGATHGVNSTIAPDAGAQVWHHLVGVCDELNSNVTLYVDGAAVGTASISPGAGLLSSSRAMLIGARPSNSTTNANDFQFVGFVNDVAVYNYALSAAQVESHYASAGVPPNFTQTPPANVSVNGYGTLTIPAAAVGTPPINYTWVDTTYGTNVATGSTNGTLLDASLNVPSVPLGWNSNVLQLTVQNAYGSTNILVSLTVFTNAPQITADLPPQVTVVSGKPYTYSVAVVGPQPYSYQWYNGATLLSGETNSTYSLVAGSPGSTTYSVVVTNIFGAVTSTVSTFTSVAQLNGYAYATNVLALNPAGYWPLQETNAPAPATMETNYGVLGALGNAYYAITNNPGPVQFGQNGAINGDTDPAVLFAAVNPANGSITNINGYAFVPRTTPALTMRPPFSFECWINSSSAAFGDIMGEGGGNGLNAANGAGNFGGVRLSYGGNNTGGANLQFWVANGNGTTRNSVGTPANSLPTGSWHHCVATYDGTNTVLYIDGVQQVNDSTSLAGANTMNIDTWSPFTIGGAFWENNGPNRETYATLDEVAVYTNILSPAQVTAHFQAGTTPGNYVQTITNDRPLLYYRMDCPGFTNPPVSICPEAVNYGSAAVNGTYLSGIPPGAVPGPGNNVLGTNVLAAPINGVISCVDAGTDPSFNPTGKQSFTAVTWFQAYPADDRAQTIMSHGVTNWAMNLDGTTGRLVWNLFASGSQVTSTNILNDGNWHFVAGVYDGSTSNSYLYVDGQLNASLTLTNLVASEPNAHLYLGGNSDFTAVGSNQRYFGGALAQAAFFTNALTAAQIQSLYVVTAVTPTISISRLGTAPVITYTGTLLSSTNVVGPYSPVSGATSPYTVPLNAPQTFYRTGP